MHTLDKREVGSKDFEKLTSYSSIEAFNEILDAYKFPESNYYKDITTLKNHLPEGWLQERMICTNYMTLQNICRQREKHRLKYWQQFVIAMREQLEHPYLIFNI